MPSRVIGIDYGKKRVGMAISDPLNLFAIPIGTFPPDAILSELEHVEKEYGIEHLVVGWPVTLDGEEEEATQIVQLFINRLQIAFPEIEIIKQDERYSSKRALKALIESGIRKKARGKKGRLDAASAAIILQDFLDDSRSEFDANTH